MRGFFVQCKVESNNGSEARLFVYTGRTFCMHAVKYTVRSNPSSHNSAVQSRCPGRSNLHYSDYEPCIWFRVSIMAICK
jgi:hypothetical protein